MTAPLHSVDYSAYLAEPNEPERELRRIFQRDEPLTILDIGACEGEDSVRYARCFPSARILAFEPLPANQALVRANLARYGAHQVELVPLALSDRSGEATFHVSSGRPPDEFAGQQWNYGNKSSSLLPPAQPGAMHGWVEFKETLTVPTDTLDRVCAARALDRIDFIHMDVQGAEHLVLAGAAGMLRKTTALWLEVSDRQHYTGQHLRGEMELFMREHGFALCLEVRRETEGDQFYVNTRVPRTWRYLATRRVLTGLRRMRARLAGR